MPTSSRPTIHASWSKATSMAAPLSDDAADLKFAPAKNSTATIGLEALAAKYGISAEQRPMDVPEIALRLAF